MDINHPNLSLADGKLDIGKQYGFAEHGRRYVVECLAAEITDGLICLRLTVLKTDPKPHSLPVGKVLDVSINVERIGYPGMWQLYEYN